MRRVFALLGAGIFLALTLSCTREFNEDWAYELSGCLKDQPAIGEEGTIYVGLTQTDWYGYTGSGDIFTLSPDGSLQWEFHVEEKLSSNPAIGPDGIIYFGTWNQDIETHEVTAYLYALSADGELKWSYPVASGEQPVAGGESQLAIGGDGTIYYVDHQKLLALDKDGNLMWQREECRGPVVLGEDGTIYCSWREEGSDYLLLAIKPDGSLKWSNTQASDPVAIGEDGTVYCSYHGLTAVGKEGNVKWEFDPDGRSGSPVIDEDGTIYFACEDSCFYALNPDGTLKWKYQTDDYAMCSPSIASDGTIYFIGYEKRKIGDELLSCLYAFDSQGNVLWRYKTELWIGSDPVLGPDGTVYVYWTEHIYDGCSGDFTAVSTESGGPPPSPWPTPRHDNQNTNRASR